MDILDTLMLMLKIVSVALKANASTCEAESKVVGFKARPRPYNLASAPRGRSTWPQGPYHWDFGRMAGP